jgi:hypothetical protein
VGGMFLENTKKKIDFVFPKHFFKENPKIVIVKDAQNAFFLENGI